MVSLAIYAELRAKPGKAEELEAFLKDALPLANQEAGTVVWFALRLTPDIYGIFDAFNDEDARNSHLQGPIASALMAHASELLDGPPAIHKVDVLAAKLSG